MTTNARILIVSIDSTLVQALTRCVNELGHAVCAAVPGRDLAAELHPELALVDLGLGQEADDAIEAVNQIQRRFEIPVLYLADSMDDARLERACMTAPFGYMVKPVDGRQLRLSIDAAMTAHEREQRIYDRAGPPSRGPSPNAAATESERDAWYAALLEAVIEASSEGIIVTDAAGRFMRVSPAARKIIGGERPLNKLETWMDHYDVFYADGQTPLAAEDLPLEHALYGDPRDMHLIFRRKPSDSPGAAPEDSHISIIARPILDAAGRVLGAVALFRDVTDSVTSASRLEHAVSELHKRVQIGDAIVKSMSDGVLVVDKELRFTLFNPSAKRIIGIGMTDTPAADWPDVWGMFFPDKVTPFPADKSPLVRAVRGEATKELDLFIRNSDVPDGVFVNVNGTPVRDSSGNLVGGVSVYRDVTRRTVEREALLQAFASGRLEIIETILHNIGNAINSVAVGVDTVHERLRDAVLLNRFKNLADMVAAHENDWDSWLSTDPRGRKMVPYLLTLIRDMVIQNDSLARIVDRVQNRVHHIVDIIQNQESFALGTAERTTIDLRSAIDEAAGVLEQSLFRRHVRIEVDCAHAPAEIVVHERQFREMLVNLIKNSMESIDDERVRQVKVRGDLENAPDATSEIRIVAREESERLEIEVIDNGIGIDPQHMQTIFAAGYTTKESRIGLGLHLTANYVGWAGGRIDALSKGIGTGTTFRVVLPLARASPGD